MSSSASAYGELCDLIETLNFGKELMKTGQSAEETTRTYFTSHARRRLELLPEPLHTGQM